jgi:hypothetical protein
MGTRAWGVALVLAAATLLAAPGAKAAGPSAACFDAYVQGQRLRKEGKLQEALEQVRICAAESCPALIKADCTRWSDELERALPTVVFVAKDEHGSDLADVQVYVDDRKVADRLDGRPMPVNPGEHTVRFESGQRKVEQKVVIAEGQTNRSVKGDFAPATPPPPPAPEKKGRHIPVISFVLGGVGVVGLVSFVGFGAADLSAQSCKPTCSQAQADAVHRDAAIADVSWIMGVVALGGAAAFWLLQPSQSSASPPSASLRIDAQPVAGGASLRLQGTF